MKKQSFIILITIAVLSLAFTSTGYAQEAGPRQPAATAMEKDPHSFANTSEVVVTNLYLDVRVDFDKKQIAGKATLSLNNKTGARRVVLDTRDLTIEKVTLEKDEREAKYSLGGEVKYMGRPLDIEIAPDTKEVTVYYRTSPRAAAVQWLDPAQTAGKKRPFLFTQSQAILARTWVPCQDTPSVRMTYRARVQTPPDLLAVMSAKNSTRKTPDGIYNFDMPQPVPSYLLALAVGDIEFRGLGPRSGVYAEPPVVERAAYEFADMEKMIEAAETLYGPYRWERYDVIVLPPSFPFGGMENPRLTFATPTILAGDRSLVSLIAHELAHSWSGNLVTNATWDDFWLNEGFTVYFENRIMEAISGREYSEMLSELGLQDLKSTIKDLGEKSADTKLRLDLTGRDPDEGVSDIAYQKGYFFLRMLEENVGRRRWDAFLKKYFETHAFQSMTTERFLAYLRKNLTRGDMALERRLNIDAWVFGPGLPENAPKVQSGEFRRVEAQVKAYLSGKPAASLETKGWTSHHWQHFLRKLPAELEPRQMAELDAAFKFSETGNSEILNEWLLKAIGSKYEAAYPALERFLTSMGRRKFLKPLYTELAKTPAGLEMARRIYEKARPTYHSVSYNTVDEILKWEK
ncbi:MAG TPA: M1 family metallopeptidase [Blastocatellia bacterium]